MLQLPYGVEVSDECRDLLLRLLKRKPDDRISFEEFFEHPFLDLEHAPSEKCLPKAVSYNQQHLVFFLGFEVNDKTTEMKNFKNLLVRNLGT